MSEKVKPKHKHFYLPIRVTMYCVECGSIVEYRLTEGADE